MVAAIGGCGRGAHQHDVERLELVVDAGQLGLDIGLGDQIAVVEMPEVELHPGSHEPVQRHLVDPGHRVAILVDRVIMLGRIHMGAVMGGQRDGLIGRIEAAGQVDSCAATAPDCRRAPSWKSSGAWPAGRR